MSAEKVQVTNCILVRGLAANTSKDMMELYFENHRKSGGGPVLDVELNNEENCAIVVFEDYSSKYGLCMICRMSIDMIVKSYQKFNLTCV